MDNSLKVNPAFEYGDNPYGCCPEPSEFVYPGDASCPLKLEDWCKAIPDQFINSPPGKFNQTNLDRAKALIEWISESRDPENTDNRIYCLYKQAKLVELPEIDFEKFGFEGQDLKDIQNACQESQWIFYKRSDSDFFQAVLQIAEDVFLLYPFANLKLERQQLENLILHIYDRGGEFYDSGSRVFEFVKK